MQFAKGSLLLFRVHTSTISLFFDAFIHHGPNKKSYTLSLRSKEIHPKDICPLVKIFNIKISTAKSN